MSLLRMGVLLALLAGAAGCATTRESGPPGTPAARRDLNVITVEEVRSVGARNALEAVERLRPLWLRTRPGRTASLAGLILVYMDGVRLGGAEALRTLPAEGIASMRFLDAAAAKAQLSNTGSAAFDGAIVISSSRGQP
ncbi:MAG TPA: hypothetical protein VHG28_16620 [Longimicrobiaceae bacterium]|nr:hypothetical protein [Longimicrobiaceae bacterium]